MIERTQGTITARVRRAFHWIFSFRDFEPGTIQWIGGREMMTQAVTLFTKGRAEFYLDGVRRGDRVPGILSSEHEPVGLDGEFKLVYVEPTTRVCIPAAFNRGQLPLVKKHHAVDDQTIGFIPGQKLLVCSGELVLDRVILPEQSVTIKEPMYVELKAGTLLLEFLNAPTR